MVDINYLILQMSKLWPRKVKVISLWSLPESWSLSLRDAFLLELLKHSAKAWPKAELVSPSVQVPLRPSFHVSLLSTKIS